MNELARAIVLICQLIEAGGILDASSPKVIELRTLYLTLLRRSEGAQDYQLTNRGRDALRALEEDPNKGAIFPADEPPPLPSQPPEL